MTDYTKLSELFQTKEFKDEAQGCKTMEDFQKCFAKHGVEMTESEVVDVISQIAEKQKELDDGQISEEDLENVSGGFAISTLAFCIIVGVVCVGSAAVAAYTAYQALNWTYKRSKK